MTFFKPRSLRNAMGFSMGFTVLSKVVGYGRQWLMAFCFGVSRDVDIYMMAYGICMLSVYPFTVWYDQLVLPQLVITREEKGEVAFRHLGGSFLSFSIIMAFGMALLYALWIPAASWALSHGFSLAERREVRYFSYYFIPWILVIFPYSALSSVMKSMRYYDLVMMTDFIVSCVGTLGFLFFHRHLSSIPVFLALGYAIASLVLILKAYRVTNLWGSPWAPAMRQIFTNFRRMLLLYPIGFIHSSLDRLFQSYLFPGAIAACGYSQQLLAPLLELFAFDEAFVVPLSASEGRVQKTHRLMAGFILLSVPMALFLMWKSPAVISVMFQYGHFDQRAQAMTSSIFRVLIVVIVTGTLNTPLVRLLQISNKIYQTSYIFLANALLAFPLNLLLVFRWHWRVTGTTWALVLASVGNLITAFWIVAREGHPVPWTRLLRYFGWACSASLLAIALAWDLPHMPKPALDLALSGAAFWAMIGLLYWPVRKQIQFILYG